MYMHYNTDGFEIVDDYSYIYKRDVYRKGVLYYKFVKECAVCGKSFFMRLSYPSAVCSVKCSNNSEKVKNKISKSLTGHKRTKEECDKISMRLSKGHVVKNNIPLFDTFAHQISFVDEVKNYQGVLEVRCSLCKKWFVPKRTDVERRAQYIKGNIDRESRLYCSIECKLACPVFNKHLYPEGYNKKAKSNKFFTESELRMWSKEVLKRANWMCEYCGDTALHAHHVLPKKLNPYYALDVTNGIACCEKCHYGYAHSGVCSSVNIANTKC